MGSQQTHTLPCFSGPLGSEAPPQVFASAGSAHLMVRPRPQGRRATGPARQHRFPPVPTANWASSGFSMKAPQATLKLASEHPASDLLRGTRNVICTPFAGHQGSKLPVSKWQKRALSTGNSTMRVTDRMAAQRLSAWAGRRAEARRRGAASYTQSRLRARCALRRSQRAAMHDLYVCTPILTWARGMVLKENISETNVVTSQHSPARLNGVFRRRERLGSQAIFRVCIENTMH